MASPSRIDRSRSLILDAAEAAFSGTGYQSAGLDQVAQAAGLTRKTVYNLFGSKEALALAVIARIETRPAAAYQARIAAGEPALQLLQRLFLDSAGWCRANPALARLALAPPARPGLAPPGPDSFQAYVVAALQLGQAQGVIRSDQDARLMALMLLGIYAQSMLTILSGGGFDEADLLLVLRLGIEGVGVAGKG